MKKLIKLLFLSVAVVAFTGCGDLNTTGNTGNTSVDINYLTNGYSIQGYDYQNNDVELVYCNGDYEYYRGSSYFKGYFTISGGDILINMYDETDVYKPGSYVLNTNNGYIEEGYNYTINYPYDITVESITQISC